MKLEDYTKPECACYECVSMCERRPCWGTPDDIQKIINAGFKNKLMVDYWAESVFKQEFEDADFHILAPAIVGYEGEIAPVEPLGRCTFLTDCGKCQLHNLGLKPLSGKIATCDRSKPQAHDNGAQEVHRMIAMTWNNDKGQGLTEKFLNREI